MDRLSQYVRYIEQRKAVLFVGAGISALAGCSTLKEICRKLGELKTVKDQNKSLNIERELPRELIAYFKSVLTSEEDKRAFDGVMRGGLTPDPIKLLKEYVPIVKKIKNITPFPQIMTTNVDNCLELTREFDMAKIFQNVKQMSISNFNGGGIFHVHGYIEETHNQIWDIYDYEKRYGNRKFKSFLRNIFKNYSVLFIGYGLDDDELRQQMPKPNKKSQNSINHFALLPEDEPNLPSEEIYNELYNIQIIKYGLKKDFRDIFSRWIDSNFSNVVPGNMDQVMYLPRL